MLFQAAWVVVCTLALLMIEDQLIFIENKAIYGVPSAYSIALLMMIIPSVLKISNKRMIKVLVAISLNCFDIVLIAAWWMFSGYSCFHINMVSILTQLFLGEPPSFMNHTRCFYLLPLLQENSITCDTSPQCKLYTNCLSCAEIKACKWVDKKCENRLPGNDRDGLNFVMCLWNIKA